MPKEPNPDCGICKGTGIMGEVYAKITRSIDKVCLCTVTDEEIRAALPGVMNSILSKKEDDDAVECRDP